MTEAMGEDGMSNPAIDCDYLLDQLRALGYVIK